MTCPLCLRTLGHRIAGRTGCTNRRPTSPAVILGTIHRSRLSQLNGLEVPDAWPACRGHTDRLPATARGDGVGSGLGPQGYWWWVGLGDGVAATAAGRARELRSRCLARSRHRLTQQHGGINDRYREGCSHQRGRPPVDPPTRRRMSAARRVKLTLSTLISPSFIAPMATPSSQGRSTNLSA